MKPTDAPKRTSQWLSLFSTEAMAPNTSQLVKHGNKRIAVFHTEGSQWYAIDNRCPHEGYPLHQGNVVGCTLTCTWHNSKFDLRDGRCLKGDEEVRHYPLRIVNGNVQIDLQDEPVDTRAAKIWLRLEQALLEQKIGQIAREVVRLLDIGTPAEQLVLFVVRFDARYARWGTTHVMPVALDVLAEAN